MIYTYWDAYHETVFVGRRRSRGAVCRGWVFGQGRGRISVLSMVRGRTWSTVGRWRVRSNRTLSVWNR